MFDVLDGFDVEPIIFQNNVCAKVVNVIKPFLHFLQAYGSH
jgi:hypothetical protein